MIIPRPAQRSCVAFRAIHAVLPATNSPFTDVLKGSTVRTRALLSAVARYSASSGFTPATNPESAGLNVLAALARVLSSTSFALKVARTRNLRSPPDT